MLQSGHFFSLFKRKINFALFTFWGIVSTILILYSCKDSKTPNTSKYIVKTEIHRFDKDFFALDTTQIGAGLQHLYEKYPDFFGSYLSRILGVNTVDTQATAAIKSFLQSYADVAKVSAAMGDKQLPIVQSQLEQALKYMQYYFPGYKPDSPFVITGFVGPMDAFEPFSTGDYGDVRTQDGVGVALQLHLGKDVAVYSMGLNKGFFYNYQVARFLPETMVINAMKNIVDDVFPYTAGGKTLVEEMVEKGKRLYLLDKLLPEVPDSLKIGYTDKQLKGCYENEALIWHFFVSNDLLYSNETAVNKMYIKDGPKTPELGEDAPGYIGLFIGRQIVRAFMKENSKMPLQQLMKTDFDTILKGAAYKP